MVSDIDKKHRYLSRVDEIHMQLFKEFFRREGMDIMLIGLTMLIAIDVAFLFVPQLIGSAIDTLSQ